LGRLRGVAADGVCERGERQLGVDRLADVAIGPCFAKPA
jgi:hypothetical protein